MVDERRNGLRGDAVRGEIESAEELAILRKLHKQDQARLRRDFDMQGRADDGGAEDDFDEDAEAFGEWQDEMAFSEEPPLDVIEEVDEDAIADYLLQEGDAGRTCSDMNSSPTHAQGTVHHPGHMDNVMEDADMLFEGDDADFADLI